MQNSRKSLQLLCTATQNLSLKCQLRRMDVIASSGVLAIPSRALHVGAPKQSRNRKPQPTNVSALFKPVQVQHNVEEFDVGSELAGKLQKSDLLKILNKFTQRREIKALCLDNGLDSKYPY